MVHSSATCCTDKATTLIPIRVRVMTDEQECPATSIIIAAWHSLFVVLSLHCSSPSTNHLISSLNIYKDAYICYCITYIHMSLCIHVWVCHHINKIREQSNRRHMKDIKQHTYIYNLMSNAAGTSCDCHTAIYKYVDNDYRSSSSGCIYAFC